MNTARALILHYNDLGRQKHSCATEFNLTDHYQRVQLNPITGFNLKKEVDVKIFDDTYVASRNISECETVFPFPHR